MITHKMAQPFSSIFSSFFPKNISAVWLTPAKHVHCPLSFTPTPGYKAAALLAEKKWMRVFSLLGLFLNGIRRQWENARSTPFPEELSIWTSGMSKLCNLLPPSPSLFTYGSIVPITWLPFWYPDSVKVIVVYVSGLVVQNRKKPSTFISTFLFLPPSS